MPGAFKRILPLLDRILVRRAVAPTQTKKGIMLPEKSVPKMMEATVIAVGPGARNTETGEHITPDVSVGDCVYLPSYGGTKVDLGDKDDKKEYLLFREADILAKLE